MAAHRFTKVKGHRASLCGKALLQNAHSERSNRPALVHVKHVNPFQNVMSGQWPTVAIDWTLQTRLQTITNNARRQTQAGLQQLATKGRVFQKLACTWLASLKTQLKHIQHKLPRSIPPSLSPFVTATSPLPFGPKRPTSRLPEDFVLQQILRFSPKHGSLPFNSLSLASNSFPPINWFKQPLVEPITGVCVGNPPSNAFSSARSTTHCFNVQGRARATSSTG